MPEASEFLGIDFSTARAQDIIGAVLKRYGITDPQVINQVYNVGKEAGDQAAYLALRETNAYKQAFPGMALRAQNKLAPMTEQEYIDYKSAAISVMRNNGIPANFYDKEDDFANFIGNGVSPEEIQSRVMDGVVAARNAPQEVKDALLNFYGIDEGHLAAYWLDPTPGRGEKLLKEQAATYIGGAATKARFAGLTRQEAEQLASQQGMTSQKALEGFGALTHAAELLTDQVGETGGNITREQQIEFVAGSPPVEQALARRASQRKAGFQQGGGYAESAQGVTGLGSER